MLKNENTLLENLAKIKCKNELGVVEYKDEIKEIYKSVENFVSDFDEYDSEDEDKYDLILVSITNMPIHCEYK